MRTPAEGATHRHPMLWRRLQASPNETETRYGEPES